MKLTQFDLFKAYADKYFNGHFTVMKFGTKYKVAFGTINEGSPCDTKEEISRMVENESLELACREAIQHEVSLYDDSETNLMKLLGLIPNKTNLVTNFGRNN
ncbi:hypothetical protein [Mammaliicoccus fleurettii]|uniref:hypothetical protein n=1 Tax=Mammaliicoccus fleurettii TaxID=150056 RepID=UPI002DB5ABD9|nr:hypothetical protein [Mammaliicoccus fleurettii]MEB8067693.1 hypothetical protein [Mammaliicoccus fleurettii]